MTIAPRVVVTLLGPILLLAACQTTEQASKPVYCHDFLNRTVTHEEVAEQLDGPQAYRMRHALRCAAERNMAHAQAYLAEAILLGQIEGDGFPQGLFWLAVAERQGLTPQLSSEARARKRLFESLMTQDETAAIAQTAARWMPGDPAPEVKTADLLITYLANDRRDHARKIFNDRTADDNYALRLAINIVALKKARSKSEANAAFGEIRAIADHENDAVAQLIVGSMAFVHKDYAEKVDVLDLETSMFYILSGLRSFDPNKKLNDRQFEQVINTVLQGDRTVLDDLMRKNLISDEFHYFLLGMQLCPKVQPTAACIDKGLPYFQQAAEGGNSIALLVVGVLHMKDKQPDLDDPVMMRVIRALFSGRTKGGLWQET